MRNAAKMAFWQKAGGGYTAEDYVQSGLIHMWDGKWNVGWGEHDSSATVWTDLIGSYDLTFNPNAGDGLYFTSDALHAASSLDYADYASASSASYPEYITFECSWNRITKFADSADSSCRFGYALLDIYSRQLFVRLGYGNRAFKKVNHLVGGNTPFTMSVTGPYGGDVADSVPYINGSPLDIDDGFTISETTSSTAIRIGSGYNNPESLHYNVRVYDRILDPDEIAANYDVDAGRFGRT